MPSQARYILEAVIGIVFLFISTKFIHLAYSSSIVENSGSTLIDAEPTPNTSSTSAEGRTLFMLNCASCHHLTKEMTGPSLGGIEKRVPDRKLLIAWIKNNREVLKSGNPYFNELFLRYNKISMPIFTHLEEKEIESILEYIK